MRKSTDIPQNAERTLSLTPALLHEAIENESLSSRAWGVFDTLGVRCIDDAPLSLFGRSSVAFVTPEALSSVHRDTRALPTQIALERAFFHLNSPETIQVRFGEKEEEILVLSRVEAAFLIGASELGFPKQALEVRHLKSLFAEHKLFAAFFVARTLRHRLDDRSAWFYELMSMSYLGLPEASMELFEAYPHRGAAEPDVQLVNARYRLLLKQPNEARTLLHAISFNDHLGGVAYLELARSFLQSSEFDRALDSAQLAVNKSPDLIDAKLLLGLAQRGIAYPSGEEEGLKSSLSLFQEVAEAGGFNSAEALFHAGTVFARLGALDEAEEVFRQSLFQRDRYACREALIRVLALKGTHSEVATEFEILERLCGDRVVDLREEVAPMLAKTAPRQSLAPGGSSFDSGEKKSISSMVVDARSFLSRHAISVAASPADFGFFDEFINYYAPSGEFSSKLKYGVLCGLEEEAFVRAVALHLGAVLSDAGVASWGNFEGDGRVSIRLKNSESYRVPLEDFVRDRVRIGAGSDTLSDLSSILIDVGSIGAFEPGKMHERVPALAVSPPESVSAYIHAGDQASAALTKLGYEADSPLGTLSTLDAFFNEVFEPGGTLKQEVLIDDLDETFLDGAGYLLGRCIVSALGATWHHHPEPQGVGVYHKRLGWVFPVARVHRRAFFAAGCEPGAQLSSLELAVAAAQLAEEVARGEYPVQEERVNRLRMLSIACTQFSDEEMLQLVQALFPRLPTS